MADGSIPTEQSYQLSTLTPYRFDPSSGTWEAGGAAVPLAVDRLTLVTYNLWYHEYRWEDRLAAVLRLVREAHPHVIAFQEVTQAHLTRILAEDWIRGQYQVSDASGVTLEPNGVLLLSRIPINSLVLCHLPSRKKRKMVLGELETGYGTLHAGSIHLESSPLNLPVRLEQLDRVLPSLHNTRHSLLMGDFNFDPRDQAEQSRIAPGYTDLWPVLHGAEPGYTVDSRLNEMRFFHKQRQKRARYDRILLRSADGCWQPESARIIGTQPISADRPLVYPSDHFGLLGVVTRRPSLAHGR
jgi:tyrosyl-DNA phosphodiesterase 2